MLRSVGFDNRNKQVKIQRIKINITFIRRKDEKKILSLMVNNSGYKSACSLGKITRKPSQHVLQSL
ncbi:hypothetical protein FDUTEX481_07843 [Tolypothrix sp. PCC 7601]|nr:hypothetical protein FDUTEX481_07843 [Tolypothrix sp. PCC 7601]